MVRQRWPRGSSRQQTGRPRAGSNDGFGLDAELVRRVDALGRALGVPARTLRRREMAAAGLSSLLIGVCLLWQPVAGDLYRVALPFALLGYAIQIIGVFITARGSSAIDVLDLAGIRRAVEGVHGRVSPHVPLQTSGVYGFVRHPLYFAWLLFVFATPHMTFTRLEFAVVSSLYLALAIPLDADGLDRQINPKFKVKGPKLKEEEKKNLQKKLKDIRTHVRLMIDELIDKAGEARLTDLARGLGVSLNPRRAIEQARIGRSEGGVPIGAALIADDGTVRFILSDQRGRPRVRWQADGRVAPSRGLRV